MLNELDDLELRAKELRKKNSERMKGNYHYAKGLGFSPSEAAVLMGRTKDYIKRLAFERNSHQEASNGETA